MKTILFQGDSITDACRKDEYICHLGMGYPAYVAGRLGLEHPTDYAFVNRGISGNKIVDVYARIKRDIINLQPDVLSLLIGVNDAAQEIRRNDGMDPEKFQKIYEMLLDEVLTELPNVKIILLEPFVLPGSITEEQYDLFRLRIEEMADVVYKISKKYNLPFVPLQKGLDMLAELAPPAYWLIDGMHPSIYYHQYIADRWIETYTKLT